MTNPASLVEADYTRQYGTHSFTTIGGETATVISEPTWETFLEALESASSLGGIALSPELITSPNNLADIPQQHQTVRERINEVRRQSAEHPDTLIVLGTATFDRDRTRPANSLLFIQAGQTLTQTNKQFSFNPAEKRLFTLRQAKEFRVVNPRLAAIVCSDILGEGSSDVGKKLLANESDAPNPTSTVGDTAETVLLSACWATPVMDRAMGGDDPVTPEERFRRSLETRVGMLFRSRPNIQEVIVADRLASGIDGVNGPYNGHFTRRTEV